MVPVEVLRLVREEISQLGGLELEFFPPGCPPRPRRDWGAVAPDEARVLDVPYVRYSSICSNIDKWLQPSRPKLDIEKCPTERHGSPANSVDGF